MGSCEMVFQKLRKEILEGRYHYRDELREAAIGKELGVSRTPVREALRQLELEGLVTIIPNKGTYVNGISEKDIQDIYLIRARLEGLCARMAAEDPDETRLEAMDETLMLAHYYVKKRQPEQLCKMDGRFHSLLYESCGSRILESHLKDFHQYVQRVRRNAWKNEKRAMQATMEHQEILDAIRAKNPEDADRLATLHIMNSIKNNHYTQVEKLLVKEAAMKKE